MIYQMSSKLFVFALACMLLSASAFVQQPVRNQRHHLQQNPMTNRVQHKPLLMAEDEEVVVTDVDEYREGQKKKMPKGMYNADGKPYAPWMMDSVDPEAAKRSIEERRARKAAEKKAVQGALAVDPQAMELSGVGLKYKMIGDEVELSWGTGDETGNVGFIVTKRAGGSDDWQVVASYKDWAPLNSKGPEGGQYTFMDPDSQRGPWVYRVSDVNEAGVTSDLCQTLVEVQDEGEQLAAKALAVGIVVVLGGFVAAGFLLDPLQ